jgi:preprotein translocase subunit SecG
MMMAPMWAAVPSWVPWVLNLVLLLVSIFLILLVLIQRGKGGGLAGAFGGAGGSSAFGSRAGDTFTRVTIYTAAVWILLIMFLVKLVMGQAIANEQTKEPTATITQPDSTPPPEEKE